MAARAFVIPVPGPAIRGETDLLLCLLVQTGKPRPTKVASLAGPVRQRQVYVCGAEIVQFVGNRWKRNFPRRRSLAPVVSTSGKVSVAIKAALKKHSGRKFSRQTDDDSHDPVCALFAARIATGLTNLPRGPVPGMSCNPAKVELRECSQLARQAAQ